MLLANAAQMRQADALTIAGGVPGEQLMENAGSKATRFLLQQFPQINTFIILAGPGNNGGDGLVIARLLHRQGKEVLLVLSAAPENYKGDALLNWNKLKPLEISFLVGVPGSDWINKNAGNAVIVDALLGTGISAAVREPVAGILIAFSGLKNPVVAIDLPSGLNADSGEVLSPPLRADFTVTFQLPKVCHYVMPAAAYCGKIIVADIGISGEAIAACGIQRHLITPDLLVPWLKQREINSHKGSFGHTLLIGGSRNMAGAISLSSRASLAAGAGLCTALVPGAVRCAFFQQGAEVMTIACGDDSQPHFHADFLTDFLQAAENKNAVAAGPGMGTHPDTADFLGKVLSHIQVPLLLDADALNLLSANPDWWEFIPQNTILTPHPGEMARLRGEKNVQEHRLEIAEAFARERNVVVVLKGANTIVACPDGTTYVNPTGNPGMATAGSGDVLTGILTGLLAQGYAPAQAAALGVYLHGLAGDLAADYLAQESITAERILHETGRAFWLLQNESAPEPEMI